jgi:hypothetical protein
VEHCACQHMEQELVRKHPMVCFNDSVFISGLSTSSPLCDKWLCYKPCQAILGAAQRYRRDGSMNAEGLTATVHRGSLPLQHWLPNMGAWEQAKCC